MQNLETYHNLEVEMQLAKIQITTAFQNYLKKVCSISMSQHTILQNAGINPARFIGSGSNGRSSLLRPEYFDPATIFGPTLALFNTMGPQVDTRTSNQTQTTPIPNPRQFVFQNQPMSSQNMQGLSLFQNRLAKPLMKMDTEDKDGLLDELFDQRVSGTSTKYSFNGREEAEVDTGKKIVNEKVSQLENFDQGNKITKVKCGHPWKPHHAKVIIMTLSVLRFT